MKIERKGSTYEGIMLYLTPEENTKLTQIIIEEQTKRGRLITKSNFIKEKIFGLDEEKGETNAEDN